MLFYPFGARLALIFQKKVLKEEKCFLTNPEVIYFKKTQNFTPTSIQA
jgi:hypothetical protein